MRWGRGRWMMRMECGENNKAHNNNNNRVTECG
jgi:hypothetical protein